MYLLGGVNQLSHYFSFLGEANLASPIFRSDKREHGFFPLFHQQNLLAEHFFFPGEVNKFFFFYFSG